MAIGLGIENRFIYFSDLAYTRVYLNSVPWLCSMHWRGKYTSARTPVAREYGAKAEQTYDTVEEKRLEKVSVSKIDGCTTAHCR